MCNANIIIAEDESHTRVSLNILLKRAGYKVTSVSNGKNALDALLDASKNEENDPYDLLLTDIQMPELTGLELIRSLKAENILIPVIVFTGFGDKDTIVDLLREGCEEYIDKPFSEDDLLSRIKLVLDKNKEKKLELENSQKQVMEIQRKLESYRDNFNELCNSVDSAVSAYKEILGSPVESKKVKVACQSVTLDKLGGDFAEIHDTEEGCDILLADVAGHDMGASYHTIMLKTFFEENCVQQNSGNEFFNILNLQLINNGKNERMVTAIFMRLNLQEMWAEIVSASHPYLLRFKAGNPESVLRPVSPKTGFVLGIMENASFETRKFNVSSGDRLFMYTDGLSACRKVNPVTGNSQNWGEDGFCEMLKCNFNKNLKDMVNSTWTDLMDFCMQKPSDDMLLLGIEIP